MLKQLTTDPRRELARQELTVRPITPEDKEFLYTLYASSREEELSSVDWDTAFKEQFLRMQFKAQHEFYHQRFIEPQFLIILLKGKPIGRIYIDRRKQELTLAEITLLPDYRNQGIGSTYIRDLMLEATNTGLPLRLHVEQFNRARALYERLGFSTISDDGVHLQLEWRPETLASADIN